MTTRRTVQLFSAIDGDRLSTSLDLGRRAHGVLDSAAAMISATRVTTRGKDDELGERCSS